MALTLHSDSDAQVAAWRNTHPWPGEPYPLGATYRDGGTNFAVYSLRATGVDLCLFTADEPSQEKMRLSMRDQTEHVWHIFVPGVLPGTLYGYRVYGEWAPHKGRQFNPFKLLVDPYAKAIEGDIVWGPEMYAYVYDQKGGRLKQDRRRNDAQVCKSVVVDDYFDWGDEARPRIPMQDTIIYELHVKGFTMLNDRVPDALRGTYAGLSHPSVMEYLLDLGVTTVELLPVHHFVQDHRLRELELRNYWGYNTLSYFAPHNEYASKTAGNDQVREFKSMVRAFHAAGLEVILDVVYNHTGEGNYLGPFLNLKGVDNRGYYRLDADDRTVYTDYTGTGNTLNMVEPRVLQLVMDSLRYWVTEMHVDGFRFDLASALARGLYDVGKLSVFLDTIHQDPIMSRVKLIAEPWDIGPGGYQVGNFPIGWAEWNGKFRDCVRGFWRGAESKVPELAYRFTGSSDLYKAGGRSPMASINFVTSHDGFTLADLVAYSDKHNLANGEDNRDGDNHNESWNCGVEGPTENSTIRKLRARQQRNFLATLFLSQGVPMLSMGDEYGRTQLGNNNAYCQDNALSYFDWDWTEEQTRLHLFVKALIEVRRDNPVLRRRKFFSGRSMPNSEVSDILWIRPDGQEMTDAEWQNPRCKCLAILLNGEAMDEYDERGVRIRDDVFLQIVNSHWEPLVFQLPGNPEKTKWSLVVDTFTGEVDGARMYAADAHVRVPARSFLMFCRVGAAGFTLMTAD